VSAIHSEVDNIRAGIHSNGWWLGLIGPVLALTVLLYLSLMAALGSAQWRWDDTQILVSIIRLPLLDHFIDPGTWQSYSPANLTPWLLASYKIDLSLFGLRPTLFYLHQLLALGGVTWILYLLLRLWVERLPAGFGALLFVTGAPLAFMSQQLMTRHYVEGAIFAMLSLYWYVRYLRRAGSIKLLVSVAAFGLAATAKEIYLPLLLLLPFVPESHWRRRLLASVPFAAMVLIYSIWRAFMLGSLSGGYGTATTTLSPQLALTVMNSLTTLPALLLGSPALPFFSLVLLLSLYYFSRNPARLLPALVAAAGVLGPLLPLVLTPGITSPDRYLFLPWLTLCFAVALFADAALRSSRQASGSALLFAIGLLLLMPLPRAWSMRNEVLVVGREFDAQAVFIWENSSDTAYTPPANVLASYWFVQGLETLKSARGDTGLAPTAVIDPLFLDPDLSSLYEFNRDCLCFVDASASLPARRQGFMDRHRPNAPLSLSYSYLDRIFSWQAGPYDSGNWHFLSEQLGGLAPVPSRGELRLSLAEGGVLYLRYTSPEGWVTYSDGLVIRKQQQPTTWQRLGDR